VEWAMDLVDILMVMTVNPGFGGQSFIPSQLPKIAELRRRIDVSGRPIALQVDGGLVPTLQGKDTARRVMEAGADTLVAGSSVFGSPDYAAAIAGLRSDRNLT